jgi:hypothetical protein
MARSITFAVDGTQITITEQDDGTLLFEVEILNPDADSDLRALYFDFNDESLLAGLSATGDNVTDLEAQADSVTDVGGGTTVNGEVVKEFGKFDVGVQLGTSGTGQDQILSTTFVLSHSSMDLSLDDLSLADVGLRHDSEKAGGEATAAITANDDAFDVDEGTVGGGNLLDNDSVTTGLVVTDADVGAVSLTLGAATMVTTDGGRTGFLTVNSDGSVSFDATDASFDDLDDGDTDTISFSYSTVNSDVSTDMASATVTINGIGSPNTDPVANADTIVVSVDTVAPIPVEWLLANDTDADGDPLTVTSVAVVGATPAGWTFDGTDVGIGGTFSVTTPLATGTTLTLEYTVSDGNGGTATGTATIELAAPSTSGNDNLDISARVYDFSFLEAKEGGDTVLGGDGADTIFGGLTDGTDTVFTFNNLIGDQQIVSFTPAVDGDSYTGADDTLIGGNNAISNQILGDSQSVQNDGAFQGGDDTLIGGDLTPGGVLAFNIMIGDASSGTGAHLTGGNDTLISGTGAGDTMTGDFAAAVVGATEIGGMDTFVFGVGNGDDLITDFQAGIDTVQLDGLGFTSFGDLAGMWTGEFGSGDLTLDLDGTVDGFGDIVTFAGYAMGSEALLAGDFVFT